MVAGVSASGRVRRASPEVFALYGTPGSAFGLGSITVSSTFSVVRVLVSASCPVLPDWATGSAAHADKGSSSAVEMPSARLVLPRDWAVAEVSSARRLRGSAALLEKSAREDGEAVIMQISPKDQVSKRG